MFAGLQSLGASGLGLFGTAALPVILGVAAVGAIGGGAYVAYECLNEWYCFYCWFWEIIFC